MDLARARRLRHVEVLKLDVRTQLAPIKQLACTAVYWGFSWRAARAAAALVPQLFTALVARTETENARYISERKTERGESACAWSHISVSIP